MKSVLLVEDEFYFRQALKKYIAEYPDEFVLHGEADNGEEGLRLLVERQPDIALVDITIPSLNGLDMVEQARQAGCSTKVVILTGYSEFAYARKAITLQVQDYLLKPIKSGELYEALRRTADAIDRERSATRQRAAVPAEQSGLLELLREHRVEMLLHRQAEPSAYEELVKVCGFPSRDGGYYLALLDVLLDEGEPWAQEDRKLCNYAVTNVAGEVLSEATWRISCEDGNQTICLVLYLDEGMPRPREHLEAELLMLLSTVQQYAKLGCVITLGERTPLSGMAQAYQDVQAVHTFRLLQGRPGLFSASEYPAGSEDKCFTAADRRRLVMLLYAGEPEPARAFVGEVFGRMEARGTAPDIVYINTVEMCSVILEYLSEFGLALPSQAGRPRPYRDVLGKKTLAELRELVERQIDEALARMQGKSKDNQTELVRWISDYLEEQYHSPALSLEKIAGEFFINVQYMCALFKKHTGDTVGNRILHIRMEHAKEKLAAGRETVAEVAEQCGYTDVGYFSKCFKKYYGVSPRQYMGGLRP